MAELKYTFKTDTLFKMIFVENPGLLKRLTANLLGIRGEDIKDFAIRNPEIQPEVLGGKRCRLDISMMVDGRLVDLEIQVSDEGDYPERTLYYWAREYSSALSSGRDYSELPRVIVISIVAFPLFGCAEYYSEYQPLEATRHTPLTDRMSLRYFELPKLPEVADGSDELKLWLALFKANTEEEMAKIETIGGEVMAQAVEAYRRVSATEEFMFLERAREDARVNELAATNRARREGVVKVARTLKKMGMPTETIKEATGLSTDEILRL